MNMSSQHTRSPTSTTSYHNQHYRSFHYPSASNASTHSREPVSPLLPSSPWSPPRSAPAYNDAYDLASASPFISPIMSRTPSVAGSDRYSTISGVTGYWPQNPDNVSPAAAYVAPFGAVQVVNEHRAAARGRRSSDASDDEDDRNAPTKAEAQFSPQALTLINHFLDQLLYSFLSTARSTNLHALRPAVTEVLRHRLAKEAVANADEELQELLAGGDEDEERNTLAQVSSRDSRKWDLELVWKRTRLRVMVYMRLGEMEDDDEERFVKEQELFYGREADSRRFSSSSGLVSWSAAIFLTSVLEYIAEQSLQAAGSVAYARARRPSAARPDTITPRQVKVEDFDVEKLALDARLGRLWRTWRKTMRNDRRPMTPSHRSMVARSSFTRDRAVSLSALRRGSVGHSREESIAAEEQYRAVRQQYMQGMGGPGYDYPESDYPEHVLASNIPLPMRDAKRDVDEIEVPGLAKNSEEDTEEDTRTPQARRNSYTSPTVEKFEQAEPKSAYFPAVKSNFAMARQRSQSMPTQPRTPNLEIPGAFPLMPEERDVRAMEATQAMVPESRPSVVNIPERKDDRDQSKVLSKDVGIMPREANGGEAAVPQSQDASESTRHANEVDGQTTDPPKVKAADEEAGDEEHSTGLLTGMAAGATAVAGAALAAVGYTHHNNSEEKSRQEDLSQSREQSNEISDVALPQPRERSSKEIEALDNGKSLADIKSVVAAEATPRTQEESATRDVPSDTHPLEDGQQVLPNNGLNSPMSASPRRVEPVPEPVQQTASPGRTTLRGTDVESTSHTEPESNTEQPKDAADIAAAEAIPPSPKVRREGGHNRHDTATIAALEAPASPSEITERTQAEPKARDMPMIGSPKPLEKPSRLIINGDSLPEQTKPSPISIDTGMAARSPASPRSPRSQNLSLDSGAPQPVSRDYAIQSPNEQTRAIASRSVAASSPATSTASGREGKARDFKVKEQMNNRSPQSRSLNSVHEKQNSRGEVQDHPAMYSMATPKKETIAVGPSVGGTSTPPVVTSASIRGPEDFDNFLQGDDTVKYTLTPENVRDQRSRLIADDNKSVTKQTSHAASLAKLSGQGNDSASKRSSRRKDSSPAPSDQRQSRAGRSQSIKDVTAVSPQQNGEVSRERRRSISKPPPRNTSTHRRSGLMAREPQVMTASTRDFADFIRSTGPDREQDIKRIQTSRSTTSLHSLRNTARSQSVGAGSVQSERERTKSMTQTTMAAENIPPVPRMPASESAKSSSSRVPTLQARSATGAASGNKDLINFIRDGPEEEGSHRISRSVAPFRNTMDSDQFGEMGSDFASGAPSKPSTDVNGVSPSHTRSVSTIPSQPTPVHRATPSTNETAPTQRLTVAAEPEGDVTRKRYRNKDPYAIPSDSEDSEDEEDFLTALPRKNQRPKEESLVDFLRNNEPPTNNAPRPISGAAAAASKARQSTSEYPAAEPAAPRNKSMQSQSNGPQPVSPSFAPPNVNSTPRATGPKLEARGAGAPRKTIPRGNAGARLGAYEQSNTGDLADFLRSSGPTEESAPVAPRRQEPPESPQKEKKKSFFSRFKREKV